MDIVDFVYKVSAPVIALAMVLLTYYIYKMSTESNKRDSYLHNIVELYYKIEDDSHSLFGCITSNSLEDNKSKQFCRRISVNSTLMVYYLMRFPGFYNDRTEFERILINITYEPTRADYYDILSEQFGKFCWGIRKNEKKASRYIMSFDKKGYPDDNRL